MQLMYYHLNEKPNPACNVLLRNQQRYTLSMIGKHLPEGIFY